MNTKPSPQQTSAEQVFYQNDGTTVTNARFIVGGQTYAMRNITSVKAATYPPARGIPVLCVMAGLLMLVIDVAIGQPGTVGWTGLGMATVAGLIMVQQKTMYGVVLATAGGEVKALTHHKWSRIREITAALNDAIVAGS